MTQHRPTAVVVLAAGEGTRMRSSTPKVLHRIGGRSLLGHAMTAAAALKPDHLVVVVGHERDRVAAHVAEVDPDAVVADQDEVKGTGRAVQCGLTALAGQIREAGPLTGTVVVTYGDVPLLAATTLEGLVGVHEDARSSVTVLTAVVDDPTGYGRIVRDDQGGVVAIVEDRDAEDAQRAVREINSGIYAFDAEFLAEALGRIGTRNAQGEMYLTDVVAVARADSRTVVGVPVDDVWQVEGVNDRVQLSTLGRELNRRLLENWMRAGVSVIDPATTWVDVTVSLSPDVTLLPGTQLHGATTIAAGATIGPDTTLTDCEVGASATVTRTHASSSLLEAGCVVGPFSYLRPGTRLGPKGKIGAFVEAKNADIGPGSKVPHLTYVGDATIGEGTNIGAATVFVNYDGAVKHHTTVGDHVRIGSDTMLVAPLTIGDGAYTAAGSVITDDVPPGAMAVARGRQRNVEGWVERRRPGTTSAAAAQQARAEAEQSTTQAVTGLNGTGLNGTGLDGTGKDETTGASETEA